jgi:shikimate kinase
VTADAPAIVLVGPMGVGKSSIGRRVAKALGVPFTDTDAVIVREHGAISAIFDEHGEPYFRALERDAVHEALGRPGVLALGGGAAMHPETRAELAGHRVVLLTVDARTVASRLRDDSRPLLRGSGVEEWARIYAARKPIYEEVATVTFDTSHGPLQAVVDAIVAWSKENPR